jgi:hypothetical protein
VQAASIAVVHPISEIFVGPKDFHQGLRLGVGLSHIFVFAEDKQSAAGVTVAKSF